MINGFDDTCAVLWHKNENLVIIHPQTIYKKSIKCPHTQQVFRTGTLYMDCAQGTKNKVHVTLSIDLPELY